MHWFMHLVNEAEFWVGFAFLVFAGLMVYFKVPGAIAGLLDARGAKIEAQLAEASKLRDEAQALLAGIKAQHEAAEKAAEAMLANAKLESERLGVEAKAKMEEQIARRVVLAERKIAVAEAQAAADVKAAAADLAAQAAEAVLATRLATTTSDPLIDEALKGLPGRFQ